jgi:hypothetical protein
MERKIRMADATDAHIRIHSHQGDSYVTACELLQALHARDIRLAVQGDSPAYDAPDGSLTAQLLDGLRQHKTTLLALLTQELLPLELPQDTAQAFQLEVTVAPSADEDVVPEGETIVTNPKTGQQFVICLYRCPACGGAQWEPGADGVWHCLTCAADAARKETTHVKLE